VIDTVRGKASLIPTSPARMVAEHGVKPAIMGNTRGECAAYVMWLYFNGGSLNVKATLSPTL